MPDKKKSEGGGGPPAAKRAKDGGETSAASSPSVRAAAATIKRKASDAASSGDGLTYDPMHFIRSHSKNNDPADIQTQIWEVVFEPDPLNAERTTSRVATCGGNSICIIDVNTGTVLMKYKHKELKENFYTLAWTTLELDNEKTNILVSGGIRGEVRMFHPNHKVCFHEWRPVDKKNIAVNSLVFHSENPTWLFCGTSDGYVALWDIGTPTLPSYDGVNPKQLLKLFPDYGDVYNIAWTGDNRWLLAGTAAGLVGWNIEDDKVLGEKEYRPTMIDFIMPENKRDEGENPIVDSLAVASNWTIVSKCALHGLIYVWNLRATIKEVDKLKEEKEVGEDDDGNTVIEQEVFMLAHLKWSDTDNFYMNLGCHKGRGLIACGDDKGQLWLYNQPQFGRDPGMEGVAVAGKDQDSNSKEAKEAKENMKAIPQLEVTARLSWPELQDDHLENSRKVPLDRHDIIVDKVAASHDGHHIVAVTSNNMVCIWRRTSDDDSSSTTASE